MHIFAYSMVQLQYKELKFILFPFFVGLEETDLIFYISCQHFQITSQIVGLLAI